MQGIYAQLMFIHLPSIYIYCIVLDLGITLISCTGIYAEWRERMGGPSASYIYIYMYCARSIKKTHAVYWYAGHLSSIDGGFSSAFYIYMHCARSIKRTNVVYRYARHLCLMLGVHLTLVSKCALVSIYRSAIPLHVAVKLICFTIGLLILLSKDHYINLFWLLL